MHNLGPSAKEPQFCQHNTTNTNLPCVLYYVGCCGDFFPFVQELTCSRTNLFYGIDSVFLNSFVFLFLPTTFRILTPPAQQLQTFNYSCEIVSSFEIISFCILYSSLIKNTTQNITLGKIRRENKV